MLTFRLTRGAGIACALVLSLCVVPAAYASPEAQSAPHNHDLAEAVGSTGKIEPQIKESIAPGVDEPSFAPVVPSAAGNYVFTTATNASLVDMSSGTTQLLGPNLDDTASVVTNIGFEFYFQGSRFTQFSVNDNGVLRLGGAAQTGTPYKPLAQAVPSIITAYGADQRTHIGDGKVHYKVAGAAPSRILVVEWLNNQSNFNSGGTADLTYQIQLHESTGVIEYVYGSMTMSAAGAADPNSRDPHIGFSSSNAAGTVGSVAAPQSGTPAPTFDGASATPTANLYTAGVITVLNSAANGSRRSFTFAPPVPTAAANLTFSAIGPVGMTLNWADSPDELIYAIYRSTDGVDYSFVATAAQNATNFLATGLNPSTDYFWRVYAVSEGAFSAALEGNQATNPAGNIVSQAVIGNWGDPATWIGGVVPSATDHVTIADGASITIDTVAVAYSLTVGTGGSAALLQWDQAAARTLSVTTFVTVSNSGNFHSAVGGSVTTHLLTVGTDLINNGVLDFSTNGDTVGAGITFTGAASNSFAGSGPTTDIWSLTVNKGAIANVLTLSPSNFTVRGAATDVAGFLTLSNGTFRLAGTFSGVNRVFTTAGYTIPATAGFWLDNPNYSVAAQTAATATVSGLLRVSGGVFNVGTAVNNSLAFGAGSSIVVDGGSINTAGRFGVTAAGTAFTYNQSSGLITTCQVGSNSTTLACFDMGNAAGSSIVINGGTVVVRTASTAASGPRDYRHQAGTSGISTVTGGALRLGSPSSPAAVQGFDIAGVLPNLVVDGSSAAHTATFLAPAVFNNITLDISIDTGTTLNVGNNVFLMNGVSLTNNGTLVANGASTRFIFFRPSTATSYAGSGSVTAPMTSLELQNDIGLTIDPAANNIVVLRVILFSGDIVNSDKLTLGNGGATASNVQIGNTTTPTGGGAFDEPFTFNLGTGGQNVSYLRTTSSITSGPEINPSRVLNNLTIDDNDPAHVTTIDGGDLQVNGTLSLANGRVVANASTLTATNNVTRTNGWVDGNFRKTFAAAGSKTFEVGSENGYSPVVVNATAGTFPGTATVRAVQGIAPNISPPDSAITRHWEVISTDVTSADLTFNYLDPTDIPGTVTEADLLLYRRDGGVFTDLGGVVNTGANTAAATGVGTFGVFTLAEPGAVVVLDADLSITKDDGVTSVTPGGSTTYTIVASNAGPSDVTGATVADTFPAELTCTWTCAGSGGGTCSAAGSGNINDVVDLPVGASATYTAACTISPSALGSIANTATVAVPVGFNDPDMGNNSATDTDTVGATADLSITKTDGVTSVVPGQALTYTIVASNAGPSGASGATVTDSFPASLTGCSWTCAGAGGGTCPANGAGNIGATVNLPAGGSTTFTANCTVSPSATGSIMNTAAVAAPGGVTDPTPGNNSATDTDMVQASADVEALILNDSPYVQIGGQAVYTFVVTNNGPAGAGSVTVNGGFPPALLANVAWTCSGLAGGVCGAPNGSGGLTDTANLPSGGSVTYAVTADVIDEDGNGNVMVMVQAFVGGGVTDPQTGNNEDQVSSIVVIFRDGFEADEGDPDIVVFDNVNFLPPATFDGGSVRWDTGENCNCDDAPFNFNIWASGGTLAFFWPQNSNNMEGGVSLGGTTYAVLGSGATIGPASTFIVSAATTAAAPWRMAGNVDGYLGFRFRNPDTSQINYGYVRIQTTGTGGFPATIVGWAYNQAGDPITIP